MGERRGALMEIMKDMIYNVNKYKNKETPSKIVQISDECSDCEDTQEKEIINDVSKNHSTKSCNDDPQTAKDQVDDILPVVEKAVGLCILQDLKSTKQEIKPDESEVE